MKMKNNLFKIRKPLAVATFLLVCNINILAQIFIEPQLILLSGNDTGYEVVYCDEQNVEVKFKLTNTPIPIVFDGEGQIQADLYVNSILYRTITPSIGNIFKGDVGDPIKNEAETSISIGTLNLNENGLANIINQTDLRHVEFKIHFNLLYNFSGFQHKVKSDKELTIQLWATPKPQIISPDKDEICGFSTTFKADTRWSDISTYSWATTNEFLSLSNTDKSVCNGVLQSDAERFCNVILAETTGGKCTATDTRTFSFKHLPEATIAPTDHSEQFICTAIDDDPSFNFQGDITTQGNGPFAIILSNGQEFNNLPEAKTVTKDLTMKQSGELVISSIVDANGCIAEAKGMKGSIIVIDRKPQLDPPTDTIEFVGRDVRLTRIKSNTDIFDAFGKEAKINFNWEITNDFHRHGNHANDTLLSKVDNIIAASGWNEAINEPISSEIYGYTSNPSEVFLQFRTNKTGYITTKYTEWNVMKDHEDCYNSIEQVINTFAEINAPNGISPNADRKNDYLVFEGLPDNNHLTVYDARGKIVYEQKNYRNNWNAEGIDDGYYIYIFEGEGIKTIKETLVIKRNKK